MQPKLTLHDADSPTAQVIAQATAEHTVTDSNGRKVTLKKPGVLAQYRLIEALGDAAKNETYVAMCIPLLYVSAIDGDYVTPLSSKILVETLIQRLSDEGVMAVMNGVRDHFGVADPEADKAAIKK